MLARRFSQFAWRAYSVGRTRGWKELDDFACHDANSRRRILRELLLAQIRYFGSRPDALPEWRDAARIGQPEQLWRVWPQLPIVDKALLQSRFDAKELRSRLRLKGRAGSTGGSTGEPTQFFHDRPMLRAARAADIYTRLRMGWKPGMAAVAVWGSERDIGKNTVAHRRFGHFLAQDFVVDGFGIDDSTVHRILDLIERKRPVAMYGFSSLLEFVAERTIKLGRRPEAGSVVTAWNGAEMLYPAQVALFREAFGPAPLNRYGGRELSAMACQYRAGGPLHVLRPWLFVEVVDDRGRPVGPGETGRLLWTSTVCRGTPFLRYDIGDLGTYDENGFDVSGIHCLRELQGRAAGMIETVDGRKISCLYWNHLLKDYSEVRQFQVVVDEGRRLTILLKGGGFSPEREAHLRKALSPLLGDSMVVLRWVDSIPRTSQGKLLQVVNV